MLNDHWRNAVRLVYYTKTITQEQAFTKADRLFEFLIVSGLLQEDSEP